MSPPAVWAGVALVTACAFFLGGVNPASIFARVLGKDLSQGSGNPGATNAGRVLGRKWGVLVGVLDVVKGLLPTWCVARSLGAIPAYLAGVALVLGHVFSPYLRGRGGKGVATTLGVILAVHPLFALVLVGVFLVVALVSRWVALGSLAGAVAMIAGGAYAALGLFPGAVRWATAAWAWVLGAIVLARHKDNVLERLRRARAGRSSQPG